MGILLAIISALLGGIFTLIVGAPAPTPAPAPPPPQPVSADTIVNGLRLLFDFGTMIAKNV